MVNSTGKRLAMQISSHQLPNEKSQLPAQAKYRKSRNSKRYIAGSSAALQTVNRKCFSMNHRSPQKRQKIIRFGYTASRGIAPNENGLTGMIVHAAGRAPYRDDRARSWPATYRNCARSLPGPYRDCARSWPGTYRNCARSWPGPVDSR